MGRFLTALVLCVMTATAAQAEFYVAGDILQSQFSGPTVDGTWKQDRIPGGSQFDSTSLGWDAGIGYRFAGGESLWSQRWSIEAGYRDFGGGQSAGGNWISDELYSHVPAHHGGRWLRENGITTTPYVSVVDKIAGGYGRIARGFDLGSGFEPFVSVGVFIAQHHIHVNGNSRPYFSGMIAGPTLGGGLKYDVWRGIKLRASVDSHWTITESAHPISSHWVTVGGGLEVPLNFF